MSPDVTYLFTLIDLVVKDLVQVAVKFDANNIPDSAITYWREDDSQQTLKGLLPEDLRDIGPIVRLDRIDDLVDFTK